MIARFLLGLLLRHLWSSLFSVAGTALFFCSDRGAPARVAVRANGNLITYLFWALGIAAFLMIAQAIGDGGSVKDGLWKMWEWLTTKVAAWWKGTTEVAKSAKPVTASKKKTTEK